MSYAIPTQRMAVELFFEGREPRRGDLFVAEPRRSGRAIANLLEEDARFLPFLDAGERTVSLVNRDDLVRVALLLAIIDNDPAPVFERRHRVRLEVRNGAHLDGEVLFSPPAARARLSDFLNEPARFVQLHQGNRVQFVQKSFVVRVVELASPPRLAVER